MVDSPQAMVPQTGRLNSDATTFEAGKFDLGLLEPGVYSLNVIVEGSSGQSEPRRVDVVIYEDAWNSAFIEEDLDRDGLPDAWEREQFQTLSWTGEDDPDGDDILNRDELARGSDANHPELPGIGMVEAEYWIGADPGEGRATPFTIDEALRPSSNIALDFSGKLTSNLEPGHYQVGIRAKRENGEWSATFYRDLFIFEDEDLVVPEPVGIKEIEYSLRDVVTPRAGEALTLEADPPHFDARSGSADTGDDTAALEIGWARASLRAEDLEGVSGEAVGYSFEVQEEDTPSSFDQFVIDSLFGSMHLMGDGKVLSGSDLSLSSPFWIDFEEQRYVLQGAIGTGGSIDWFDAAALIWDPIQWGSLTWLWSLDRRDVVMTNDFFLGSGSGELPRFEWVTSSVPEFVYDGPDVRYRSLGYTGTGDIPASGTTASVSYFLTQDSSIEWLWQKEYRVQMTAKNGMVGGYREWYAEGSDTNWQPIAEAGYRFVSWAGDLSGTEVPGVFAISAAQDVEAVFVPDTVCVLEVVEVDGSTRRLEYPVGERISLEPLVPSFGDEWERVIPSGWRLEGSYHDTMPGTRADFELIRDSRLVWVPLRQVRLEPVIIPESAGNIYIEGRQSHSDKDWYDVGTISVRARPAEGFRFVEWYFQNWADEEADFPLFRKSPLVARFAKNEPLGDWVFVNGGALSSPNNAVPSFEERIGAGWMQPSEMTTTDYSYFLNWMEAAGYLERSNRISVRAENPLAAYGPGLTTEWYLGSDWAVEAEFTNTLDRLEIDFGAGSPADAGVAAGSPTVPFTEVDFYVFRARGELYVPADGTVAFRESSDDETVIWVNGVELLSDVDPGFNAEASLFLEAGWHAFEVVYREISDSAAFKVEWMPPGAGAWAVLDSQNLRARTVREDIAELVQYHEVFDFYDGIELVDLDTPNVNIEKVDGLYRPVSGAEDEPIVDVTWFGAKSYARWLREASGEAVRLPNEWFWEFAASGGNTEVAGNYYPWGPVFFGASHQYANYVGIGGIDIYDSVAPVAQFPQWQGLYDMAGNVFEWTDSIFEQGDQGLPVRVLKGGSWNQPSQFLANSNRQIYRTELFSDQATGFRLALLGEADFSRAGYVAINPLEAEVSPHVDYVEYTAPVENFLLAASEVSRGDFLRFINRALAEGWAELDGNFVKGLGLDWYDGQVWYEVVEADGVSISGNSLLPAMNTTQFPVNEVSWYGAMAYCHYLSNEDADAVYTLPDEWEWEAAMLSSEADTVLQDAALFDWNLPYAENKGFWPGFFDVVGGLQEWTGNNGAANASGLKGIRGGADNLPDLYRDHLKVHQYIDPESTRSDVGFRTMVRSLKPQVLLPRRSLQLQVGQDAIDIQLKAASFLNAPTWSWNVIQMPGWAALVDDDNGFATLQVSSPGASGSGEIQIRVGDGTMETEFVLPYSVQDVSPLEINGLPAELDLASDASVLRLPLEVADFFDASFTWGISGVGAQLETTTGDQTVLNLDPALVQAGEVVVTVTAPGYRGEARTAVSIIDPVLRWVNPPTEIYLPEGDARVMQQLEITGLKRSSGTTWSIVDPSHTGISLNVVNDHLAQLVLQGDITNGTVGIRVENGGSVIEQIISLSEVSSPPRILAIPADLSLMAKVGESAHQLIAQDRDLEDILTWSLTSGQGWARMENLGRGQAVLWIDTSEVRASDTLALQVSDGQSAVPETLQVEVVNNVPVLQGTVGTRSIPFVRDLEVLSYEVLDNDPGQKLSLSFEGVPSGVDVLYTGNASAQLRVGSAFSGSATVTIRYGDGFSQLTDQVELVRLERESLIFEGLPLSLPLERYSPRKRIPFSVEGMENPGVLEVDFQHEVSGVRIEHRFENEFYLWVDSYLPPETYSVVLLAESGEQYGFHELALEIKVPVLDDHSVVAIEYFFDTAPAEGVGQQLEMLAYPPQSDLVVGQIFEELDPALGVGWHRLGWRAQSLDGTWSTVRWTAFYVYEDVLREGVLTTRPDGSISHSQWDQYALLGEATALPGNDTYVDRRVGTVAASAGEEVFLSLDGMGQTEEAIYWGEYFINEDPGEGAATRFYSDADRLNGDFVSIDFDIDVTYLEDGHHSVGIRFQETDGAWSEVRWLDFFVYTDSERSIPEPAKVVRNEYFWDQVGGEGFGFGLPMTPPAEQTEIGDITQADLQTAPVDTGEHFVYLRFRDNDDEWGEVRRTRLEIDEATEPLNLVNLLIESNIGVPGSNFDSMQLVGTEITLNVPKTYALNNVTYANFGFIGQGSAPSFGSDNFVTFEILEASDVTWIWGDQCEIVARTPFGEVFGPSELTWFPDFNTGFGYVLPLDYVVLSVPSFVDIATGERQYSIGWIGTGSIPAVGFGSSVGFLALDQRSEIDWLWEKRYQLDVEVEGKGRVFGNDVWIREGDVENLEAVPMPGYRFVRWELGASGTETTAQVTMDMAKTVRAVFTEYQVWEVLPYTIERRLVGSYESGDVLTHSIGATLDLGVGSRAAISGWTGVGSCPPSGLGTQIEFTVEQDSEIRWEGVRQHWIDLQINGQGLGNLEVTGSRYLDDGSWYDEGAIWIEAAPSVGQRFVHWDSESPTDPNPMGIYLDAPSRVGAIFRQDVADVPDWVDVPAGSIQASPNKGAPGFPDWIDAFEIGQNEFTISQFVSHLNASLAEESIFVQNDAIFGREEIGPYHQGLLVSWMQADSDIPLNVDFVREASEIVPVPVLNGLDIIRVEGELYHAPLASPASLYIDGVGQATVNLNGVPVETGQCPLAVDLNMDTGWNQLSVVITNAGSSPEFYSIEPRSGAELVVAELMRHQESFRAPIEALDIFGIGGTPYEQHLRPKLDLYPSAELPQLGEDLILGRNLGRDFILRGIFPYSLESKGLMLRSSLSGDSAFFEVRLNPADAVLECSWRQETGEEIEELSHALPRSDYYELELEFRGGRVYSRITDIAGARDALSGLAERSGIPLMGRTESAVVAGYTGPGGDDVELLYESDTPYTYRTSEMLVDLSLLDGFVVFENGSFSAVAGKENYPAIGISFVGAKATADLIEERLGGAFDISLPTEWQFERAAGVGEGYTSAWAAALDPRLYANIETAAVVGATAIEPVSSRNGWNGIYDLAGNVWEWTDSLQIPGRNLWHTIRGGSYRQDETRSSSTFRLFYGDREFASSEVGLRFVRSESEPVVNGTIFLDADVLSAREQSAQAPTFEIRSADFKIGSTLVTNAQFLQFLTALELDGELIMVGETLQLNRSGAPNHKLIDLSINGVIRVVDGALLTDAGGYLEPALGVTWYGAEFYSEWLGKLNEDKSYRLPTEWEWEYALSRGLLHQPQSLSSDRLLNQLLDDLGEWTSTTDALDDSLRVVRGLPLDPFSGNLEDFAERQLIDAGSVSDEIGFRIIEEDLVDSIAVSADGVWEINVPDRIVGEGGEHRLTVSRTGTAASQSTVKLESSDPRVILPVQAVFEVGQRMVELVFQVGATQQNEGEELVLVSLLSTDDQLLVESRMELVDWGVPELSVELSPADLGQGQSYTLRFTRSGDTSVAGSLLFSGSGVGALGLGASANFTEGQDVLEINGVASSSLSGVQTLFWSGSWHASGSTSFELFAINEDQDGDGIPDTWELENGLSVGDDNSIIDTDGDGYTDYEEYIFGYNPQLARVNVWGNMTRSGANMQFTVPSILNRVYFMRYSSDLDLWSSTEPKAGTGGDLEFLIPINDLDGRAFYQLVVELP